MSAVNVRRYSDPDALKEIAPANLLAMLKDEAPFLLARGVQLPDFANADEFDYEALAKLFLSPDDIPPELVERFHLVNQMSNKNAMDHILDQIQARQLELDFAADASPADVAVQLLLKNKALFQEIHAERAVAKYRSFTFFVPLPGREKPKSYTPPDDLSALEDELNEWYEKHKRGRTARVFWRQKDTEFWFYIRHAEPIKREGCVGLVDNQSGSMIYRPEKHDLLIYDADAGEIRIHADCKSEPELFRTAFGAHLFGDPNFFPPSVEKYTLDPLKSKARAALAFGGIHGILSITLKEVEWFRGLGDLWEREVHKAEDVFSVFEDRAFQIPESFAIRRAKFAVLFTDAKKPRTVTIKPSNYLSVGRDDDAIPVGKWLNSQGFIVKDTTDEHGNAPLDNS
jgi:hypothetical protein